MEQARCWMLTKRKRSLTSHLQPSNPSSYDHDSWEEQAFAEDAAGPLGGCIWPPRSYSCSFCRREFRSAQALGGHMNVHRRDRARLKQSPPQNDQNHNNLFQIPSTPPNLGFQYPNSHHQVCTLVYSPNPNSDPPAIPSPSSHSKASNFDAKDFFPSFSSPKKDKEASPRSFLISRPDSTKYFNIVSDPEILESGEEEEGIGCKRRRISTTSSLPFFVKSNSVDRRHVPTEVFEMGTCFIEELDLELRLGDPPKVK